MKKYLFGIFALVLAISFSAFTSKTGETFRFVGPDNSELANPDYWELGASTNETCGEFEVTVCDVETTNITSLEGAGGFKEYIATLNPDEPQDLIDDDEEIAIVVQRDED